MPLLLSGFTVVNYTDTPKSFYLRRGKIRLFQGVVYQRQSNPASSDDSRFFKGTTHSITHRRGEVEVTFHPGYEYIALYNHNEINLEIPMGVIGKLHWAEKGYVEQAMNNRLKETILKWKCKWFGHKWNYPVPRVRNCGRCPARQEKIRVVIQEQNSVVNGVHVFTAGVNRDMWVDLDLAHPAGSEDVTQD